MDQHQEIESQIREILRSFDETTEKFGEREVATAIGKILPDASDFSNSQVILAELMAFNFCEDYRDQNTGWGTYYGPMFVLSNDDGSSYTEYPSLTKIDEGILNYWSGRANECKNPILKARYADLVWDLTQASTNSKPDVSMAHISIDNMLDIADKNLLSREFETVTKLKRALSSAISLSDVGRVEKVRDAMIEYESRISDDDHVGHWGFCFDSLVSNSKARLTTAQETPIIVQLENRLVLAATTAELSGYPHAVEEAATRLASYHRRKNKPNNVKRVLAIYAEAFNRAAKTASPLQASAWLQKIHSVLNEYGMRDEAAEIASRLRQLGPEVRDSMGSISVPIEIRKTEMDEYVQQMTEGDLESVLTKIAIHFLPSKNQTENQIQELAKDNPVSFLIPRQILDADGRPVAAVGSLDDDFEGHIMMQVSQNLWFSTIFLRPVIASLIQKFDLSAEQLTD